ncbi:MAG: hypothetical protein Q8R95_09100, partial [Azonexus sp.]|nr:hypothetical protein [Azonexus sp.]
GLLNWQGINNHSPFGAGLWFMTVLLIFYLAYPLLAKSLKTTQNALTFLAISAVISTLGHIYATPPYMLWPTVFGFCLGTISGQLNWQPKSSLSIALGALAITLMLALNAAGIKQLNLLAIIATAIASVAFLLSVPLKPPINRLALLSGSILEIYFIHGYLFIRPQGWPSWLGYLMSMAIILLAAITLNLLAQKIPRQLNPQPQL